MFYGDERVKGLVRGFEMREKRVADRVRVEVIEARELEGVKVFGKGREWLVVVEGESGLGEYQFEVFFGIEYPFKRPIV